MDLSALQHDGYQVVRSVIPPNEIPVLLREAERLRDLVVEDDAPLDGRLRVLRATGRSGGTLVRGLQNCHYISATIDGLRLHPGIGRVLQCTLGPDIRTVLTSIFWKAPGEKETGIAYHQDAAFRQPPSDYRNLSESYLQIAVALDPQDDENGGLRFVPGSHRAGRILPRPPRSVLTGHADDLELRAMGLSPEAARTVRLAPGDIVMWNAYTLHGSGPNRSKDRDRRSFTVASMRTADCDAGVDAYVRGSPAAAAMST